MTNKKIDKWAKKGNVKKLIKALEDKYWGVREKAASALGNIGDERAIELLIKALGDEYGGVCDNAASALVKIGKPAVEPLIKALGSKNEFVRSHAASALGDIGDERAVEPLIKALEDKYESEEAAVSLKKLYHKGNLSDNSKKIILNQKGKCIKSHRDVDGCLHADRSTIYFDI